MICKTPIIYLDNFNNNKLFVKRDDLLPFSFGGNKARKAKLFFDEIIKGNYDCVITYGSFSSNLVRIVANYCKKFNLECLAVTPESYKKSYNSILAKELGAEFVVCDINNVKETIENLLKEKKEQGKKPYFIPGGGHGNIGTQAYVDAFNEILDYEKANDIFFDYIFFASGTGTTQSGLVCGKIINNSQNKIVGISIGRKNPRGKEVIVESVKEYLLEKGIGIKNISDSVTFIDDYIAGGYGEHNQKIIETIKEAFKKHGLPLDATYTGKAFWGMQEYIKDKNIKDKNILFIHTGGAPLFFDNLKEWNR